MKSVVNSEIEKEIEVYQDGEENLFVVLDENKKIVTDSDPNAMYYQAVDNETELTFVGEPQLIEKEKPVEKEDSTVKEVVEVVTDDPTKTVTNPTDVDTSEIIMLKIQLESLEKGTSDYRNCLAKLQDAYIKAINKQTNELATTYKSNQLEQESYADSVMFGQNLLLEYKEVTSEYIEEIENVLETSRSAVVGKKVFTPKIELVPEHILRDSSKYE